MSKRVWLWRPTCFSVSTDLCAASAAQVYVDNRKSAAERALEAPAKTAELLLARGVKTVVVCSMATTAANNTSLLQARTHVWLTGQPFNDCQ
jgi:hypothetical protein